MTNIVELRPHVKKEPKRKQTSALFWEIFGLLLECPEDIRTDLAKKAKSETLRKMLLL